MLLPFLLLSVLLSAVCVSGNADKVIFTAPESIELPSDGPSLARLQLISISPSAPEIRTVVPVIHPNVSHPRGLSSWYLLDNLQAHARYELRVCWSATQPTKWHIETYTLQQVLETPELIQDLARFSEQQSNSDGNDTTQPTSSQDRSPQSLLLLRTWAAADFYSLEKSIMLQPPSVTADLKVLDHYLLNIFPRSLLSTAVYIIIIATGGWAVSNRVWTWLEALLEQEKSHAE